MREIIKSLFHHAQTRCLGRSLWVVHWVLIPKCQLILDQAKWAKRRWMHLFWCTCFQWCMFFNMCLYIYMCVCVYIHTHCMYGLQCLHIWKILYWLRGDKNYRITSTSSSLLRQMIPRRQQEQLCSLFRKCFAKCFFLRHSQVNESPFRKFPSNILAVLTLPPGTASRHKLSI